ncbi:MAG TPA: hypothetical protein VIT65_12510 [Microlunatus sp.]
MKHEDYLKDLGQKLRWRRVDEATVADILREVASETAETDTAPDERFGPANEYAENFEQGHSLSIGFVLGTAGALLATVAAAAYVVSTIVGVISPSVPVSIGIYGTCFVVMIAAVIAGQRYDRRLPRGLRV